MSLTEIWTDRLLLRAAEKRDLPYYHKWFSDPESMKFWSTPPHTNLEETETYLKRMIDNEKYNGVTEFSVCLTASSEADTIRAEQGSDACSEGDDADLVVIGKAGLWDGREMGYIFDRENWGKGYAFEALDAILKHVWTLEDSPPEVAFADVDPENVASMRLLLKLGFIETGRAKNTYETHLGWRDSVYFEKKRPTEADDA
ncbi:hypothetical protein HYPSUDRAFT_87169 [Hypholoma sublateritium FD-334 SS-4]|uniref:N-acetyltransferase domain-containing protein n=1 Tax=Hypholoma sublateritium (strain FD-334 SS-4) TaxID=945553 RepID=A0A0D2L701_HYPSF|nr:hypothetical protein HYPSUDRAFT_87169 [Hypholoma sublateritium FD-334 SS-4]